jgi:hypothetical protein
VILPGEVWDIFTSPPFRVTNSVSIMNLDEPVVVESQRSGQKVGQVLLQEIHMQAYFPARVAALWFQPLQPQDEALRPALLIQEALRRKRRLKHNRYTLTYVLVPLSFAG